MTILFPTSGEMTDNCAANVYKLGGSLVASTETCLLRRIDGDTLDTQEKIDMSGLVNIASARALTDPDTKDVFNIAGKDTKVWIPSSIHWQQKCLGWVIFGWKPG